jgi:hydrogenase expression/formation protein HypC
MCLAYPGRIESINGDNAVIDFSGIKKEVNMFFVEAKEGDYVIVHAGFAIQKLTDEEAMDAIKGFNEIE